MKKTLYLSDMKPSNNLHYQYEAPYIYYDRHYRKWMEDLVYFDDLDQISDNLRNLGYRVV